ncbi:MAG: 23S rRNA (adenine(2503)-C(2))-methyltransferase RlmN [Candidatus Cloacimonetes bacterium]|nr:23S rRNA (adenine(2503)-C(2))-methyltransferase RlmN [Candidatus Cloacimonadota bacterium]
MTNRNVSPIAYTPEDWQEILIPLCDNSIKTARYRSIQICDWIFKKFVPDFSLMSNLPKQLRDYLANHYPLQFPLIKQKTVSNDGTTKFLLKLADNSHIEMVLIPEKEKLTLCISSQVGCLRRCRFCATGDIGFKRNLDSAEIITQLLLAFRYSLGRRITNLVFMGMGEPLDNHVNVFRAIRLMQDNRLLSFSPRRITVSTCGLIPGIRKLLAEKVKIKLAVSLNSAIQEKREYLMPVAKLYPLKELKQDLQLYRRNNPFRITLEYVMFKGFNTGKEDARALIKLLGDLSCKVNLISWNETQCNSEFQAPSPDEIEKFISYLQPLPFAVTYRKSRGKDIQAACGQLAANYQILKEDIS